MGRDSEISIRGSQRKNVLVQHSRLSQKSAKRPINVSSDSENDDSSELKLEVLILSSRVASGVCLCRNSIENSLTMLICYGALASQAIRP